MWREKSTVVYNIIKRGQTGLILSVSYKYNYLYNCTMSLRHVSLTLISIFIFLWPKARASTCRECQAMKRSAIPCDGGCKCRTGRGRRLRGGPANFDFYRLLVPLRHRLLAESSAEAIEIRPPSGQKGVCYALTCELSANPSPLLPSVPSPSFRAAPSPLLSSAPFVFTLDQLQV